MHFRKQIWYKWTLCALLLFVQLTAGTVAAWASFHTPGEPILQVDFRLPAHLEQQEEIDIILEKVQLKRSPRIKPRYYVSPFCQQYNLTPRLAHVLPYINIYQDLQPENKTGEYSLVRSFLPGYYQFLFRQTPF